MQYEQAYTFLIEKLETGLPKYIVYHDVQHTKNVISAVEHLSIKEHIEGDDLILLKTAALFHDSGFLQDHNEHEMRSCGLARKYLPKFQYTDEQIENICSMIMCTKLPQTASDLLSQLLCDADLYYLGSDDYKFYSDKLYEEIKHHKQIKTEAEWLLMQIDFIGSHKYFTKTAIQERENLKQQHLTELKEQLSKTLLHQSKPAGIVLLKDFLLIVAGVVFAGAALKAFLVPNRFFDGGVTGVSLLLHELYHWNLAAVITVLNLPLIIISWFFVGKRFAYRTLFSVMLLGVSLWLLPDTAVTNDKLLIAIFGGVFLGIGIGLIMRAGAALDGIEVLALYTLKKTSFTISEIILGINILIFTFAAFKFGIETALYSILTYFTASRLIDFVVEGIQAYTGVTIISAKSELIKFQLVNQLGRGITVYKGERGFLPGKYEVSADVDIIFTVITRLELRRLKNLVYEADPNAFVFANTIREASGGVLSRRAAH